MVILVMVARSESGRKVDARERGRFQGGTGEGGRWRLRLEGVVSVAREERA